MNWSRVLLVVALALGSTAPASAQLFGRKTAPRATPTQRVPELINTIKSDIDERKRSAAVEELSHYETKDFPQVVPTLVEVLEREPKVGVRLDAVHALGRLRPVSNAAGLALERAASNDSAIRVRLQARTTLMWYHMAGYDKDKMVDGPQQPTVKTTEPPLADPQQPWWNDRKNGTAPEVKDYRPLPKGPTQPQQQTPEPPVVTPPPPLAPPQPLPLPVPPTQGQGPALLPQE